MQRFQETVEIQEDGRYTVGLPWIAGHPPLISNKKIAECRLKSTTSKLIATVPERLPGERPDSIRTHTGNNKPFSLEEDRSSFRYTQSVSTNQN